MAGDHPALLRRLGLVIDLRVADPARLLQAQWLSARVFIDGGIGACRSARVRCQRAGIDMVSTPLGSDWSDGLLRLGDERRFSVLTLDTDHCPWASRPEELVAALDRLAT